MLMDLRDVGTPGDKEWQEFRASLSSALLLEWLLDDFAEENPDYTSVLWSRIHSGLDTADILDEEDPDRDDAVPIPRDDDFQSIEWWSRTEAELLLEQLFPHGNAENQYRDTGRGLVVVALHSALEAYASALGIPIRGPFPKVVKNHLESKSKGSGLSSSTYERLVTLDEARHLVIHNRGSVSQRYVDNVPYNTFVVGEHRPISRGQVLQFGDTVWEVAKILRDTTKS